MVGAEIEQDHPLRGRIRDDPGRGRSDQHPGRLIG
jgi:hypothetical protein